MLVRQMKKSANRTQRWVNRTILVVAIVVPICLFISSTKRALKKDDDPIQKNEVISFKDCDVCPRMVEIPEGSVMMGSAGNEKERSPDEGPLHKVSIHYSLAIGMYEVTFAEWDACVTAGACNKYRPDDEGWGHDSHPVINVSWNDAQAYVAWLQRMTGKPYRLPTESEWEFAMRGETSSPFYTGACLEKNKANVDFRFGYDKCPPQPNSYVGKTQHVGKYPPNPFGLHDMIGNVFEWVTDTWHESYLGAPANGRAWTSGGDDERRVVRGGSWGAVVAASRSANRFPEFADFRSDNVGFRVALSLPKK